MKPIYFLFLSVSFLIWNHCTAQENPKEQTGKHSTLKDRVEQSDIVVEGRVTSETGFKTTGPICTSYLVKVTKVFKGSVSDSMVEVVLYGGRYGDVISSVSDYLSLTKGDEGIFMVKDNTGENKQAKGVRSYIPYFGKSSFFRYEKGTAADLENGIFKDIESITGQPRKILGKNMFERPSKFSLEAKVENSDAIIEGMVISRRGFSPSKTANYGSAIIKVSKVFKGDIKDSIIELDYLDGGRDDAFANSYGLTLNAGQDGVFFITKNNTGVSLTKDTLSFIPDYGRRSFADYKWADASKKSYIAVCDKTTYSDIETDLFQRIETLTRQKRVVLRRNAFEQ